MMEIYNVSFIVIAKNEEQHLHYCLDSILGLKLIDCEIICVDSCSSDSTLRIMKRYASNFNNVIVKELINCKNAAHARNEGLKLASHEIVGLIDGDIELDPTFIFAAIKQLSNNQADAVTGDLDEIIYSSSSGKVLKKVFKRYGFKNSSLINKCGGILFIKRNLITQVGNFDERFDINEDLDFSLRISNKNKLFALPISMGIHHTKLYNKRKISFIFNGHLKNIGMLLAKHLDRKGMIKIWLKSNKNSFLGLIYSLLMMMSIVFSIVFREYYVLLFAFTFILLQQIIYSVYRKQNFIYFFLLHYIGSFIILFGFLSELNKRIKH